MICSSVAYLKPFFLCLAIFLLGSVGSLSAQIETRKGQVEEPLKLLNSNDFPSLPDDFDPRYEKILAPANEQQPAVTLVVPPGGYSLETPIGPATLNQRVPETPSGDLEVPEPTNALDEEAGLGAETFRLIQPWWAEHVKAPGAPAPGGPAGNAPANRTLTAPNGFQHGNSFNDSTTSQLWDLEDLIWRGISNSPRVRSLLIDPQILDARASETLGEFDPNTFVESIFNDTSDPVGNSLVTGSANRLNEHLWENSAGIRGRNQRGGQATFSQDVILRDNNSDFLVPRQQSDTKMVLRYTQPLLRGAGLAYNQSSFVIASIDAQSRRYEVATQIQQTVFEITQLYWEVYASRATILQIERGLRELERLRDRLQGRIGLDSVRPQILSANAEILRQRSNLARAVATLKSSEASLRAIVAAPELLSQHETGIIPATQPVDWRTSISLSDELNAALTNNPQILATHENLKSTTRQLRVAEHELKPTLDLVLEGYVQGLNGDYDTSQSLIDQFSTGAPSYSAGLSYARPYRNRAANAIVKERRLELRKLLYDLDATLLNVEADITGAIAQTRASFQQLESAIQSTLATHEEVEVYKTQYEQAFRNSQQFNLLVEQLLDAEAQLIQGENAWVRAQADYMISIASLKLATGTLMPMNAYE